MIIRILKTAIIIQFVQLKYRHLHVIWNAVVIKVIKIISKKWHKWHTQFRTACVVLESDDLHQVAVPTHLLESVSLSPC